MLSVLLVDCHLVNLGIKVIALLHILYVPLEKHGDRTDNLKVL